MMSEHDAPTVARATLWLDTSNEAATKRCERLDAIETSPTLPSLAVEDPLEELATTRYLRPPQPQTEVLDAQSAFSAFSSVDTDMLEHALLVEQRIARSASLRRRALPALAVAICMLAIAAAFLIGQGSADPKRAPEARPAPAARPAQKSAAAPAAAPALSGPSPADLDVAPDTRSAVAALARGDYPRALAIYGALARAHPNDAAFAAIVRRLEARLRARCAHTKGAECAG